MNTPRNGLFYNFDEWLEIVEKEADAVVHVKLLFYNAFEFLKRLGYPEFGSVPKRPFCKTILESSREPCRERDSTLDQLRGAYNAVCLLERRERR